jgi:transposase InsO family protein
MIKHNTEHIIETTGPPITCRARRLPPGKLAVAKKVFKELLQRGEIRPSKSPWASPLYMKPKSDGSWRVCGDYRAINARTKPDRSPVPNILDFNAELADKKVFSKIDVNKAFYHIPVSTEHIEKTAVITPFGLYEFLKMPFGMHNSAQTWQRFIDSLFRDIPNVYVYIDDILIASPNAIQHEQDIKKVLNVLYQAGLTINMAKCEFYKEEVSFLGYTVNSQGIKPHPDRLKAVLDFPQPKTVEQLRRFLGMANFYRRSTKQMAEPATDLYKLITTNIKRDKTPVEWTPPTVQAFESIKQKLADAILLAHPNDKFPLILSTDVSSVALGATLQQLNENTLQPLAFYSRKLSDTEKAWSTYDRELLAIFAAIKHFRPLLEGRHFTVYTDHKPLTYAFNQKLEKATPRQQRQLQYISQFTTNIQHVTGAANTFPPSNRLEHIHIDLVGPLPPSRNYTYVLTIIDRTTRWPEAIPTTSITAENVAELLVHHWIPRYGVPKTITSDQGRQFESTLFRKLADLLGIHKVRTNSYHPQSNGRVERWHRVLKSSIMAHAKTSWYSTLPWILLGLRTAINDDDDVSPAHLLYGTELRLPGDFFDDSNTTITDQPDYVQNLREQIRKITKDTHPHGNTHTYVPKTLQTSNHVFLRTETLRKALQPPYTGPHRVVSRDEKTYEIEVDGKKLRVSIDRLKPAFLINNETKIEEPNNLDLKPPEKVRRSKRRVTFPDRLVYYN